VPLIGAHGAAGHLGHVPADAARGLPCSCGGTGHLEAVSSGPGLVDLYRRHGGVADDARRVVAAAAADPVARDCTATAGRALGRALGGWVNLLDPDAGRRPVAG
jgi:glucokinase